VTARDGTAPLLVVAALAIELAPLVRRLGLARDAAGTWHGARRGARIVAATTGIGLARARATTDALLRAHAPRAALAIGIAGALRRGLAVGDVVVPADVVDGASGARFQPMLAQTALGAPRPSGRLVSAPAAALTRADKAELRRRHEADAVDMESAAIADACERAGVPWLCARSISDDADSEIAAEALLLTDAEGRPRIGAALRHVLRHPASVPALVRLGRDTRTAVARLTKVSIAIVDALCERP